MCLADELTNPALGSQIGTRNKWWLRRCDTRHHDNRCWCHAGDPRCFSLPRLQRGAGGRQSRAIGGPGQWVTPPHVAPQKPRLPAPPLMMFCPHPASETPTPAQGMAAVALSALGSSILLLLEQPPCPQTPVLALQRQKLRESPETEPNGV